MPGCAVPGNVCDDHVQPQPARPGARCRAHGAGGVVLSGNKPGLAVKRIVPDLAADDVQGSIDFYTALFDLELGMDLGWVATVGAPGSHPVQLTLMSEDATAPVNPSVTIEVADVDAVHAVARERGHEIVHPLTDEPWGVRRFFVRDPNGVVVNVMSHLPSTRREAHSAASGMTDATFVAAGGDRFGEQRGLGISRIDFKVVPQDSTGLLVLENTFHARGGPARHLHYDQDEWFYA
ncbi:MAG TPA: VOC family protein, partial [Anaerolineae bacterium]|nr:VOC family protein [Anaerolineae bacterium]